MNKRQKQILKILVQAEDYITVQQLADTMQVSLRTVHNDIKVIEAFLQIHNQELEKKQNMGIRIQGSQSLKKSLLNWIDETKESVDVLSTKIRRMKIMAHLLTYREGTSLHKLSEEFCVSKTSIVSDFEVIERHFHDYHLILIKDHKGTRVKGKEKNIRHALSQLANSFLQLEFEEEKHEKKLIRLDWSTFYRLKSIFDIEHIENIEKTIIQAESQLGYTVNDLSYVNLITHLLILIKRLRSVKSYSIDEIESVPIIDTSEKTMAIAQFIADAIAIDFQIDIPQEEINYIHQYLVCSGIQRDFLNLDIKNFDLNINTECLQLVDKMISFVSDSVHYDLHPDKELRQSLITHIIPLIQRKIYHVRLDNPLIYEIKSQYSAMFSLITIMIEMIDSEYLKDLNDDEVGFLTIHFQAAVERTMDQQKVIIVCPQGIGFSRLIAHRLERFVSSVNIVDIVSLNTFDETDLSHIDFVISTVPITSCQKPVVLVSSFLSELDIRDIHNFLVENAQNTKHCQLEFLSQVVDETVVFAQLMFETKEDILIYLCEAMYQQGYVTKNYQDTVLEREKIMSTDLGNRIAIPHGREEDIIESKVVIATLKKPVLWEQHKVDIVFLIALNMKNPTKTKNILKDLYAVMDSQHMIEAMVAAQTQEEILQLLISKQ